MVGIEEVGDEGNEGLEGSKVLGESKVVVGLGNVSFECSLFSVLG